MQEGGKLLIYDNILAIAKKKGLSLRKIEIEAGLSSGAIGKWKTRSPHVDNLMAVAKVLKVSLNTLVKENDEK